MCEIPMKMKMQKAAAQAKNNSSVLLYGEE